LQRRGVFFFFFFLRKREREKRDKKKGKKDKAGNSTRKKKEGKKKVHSPPGQSATDFPDRRIARIDAADASLFPIQYQRCLTMGTHMNADEASTRMPPTVFSEVDGRGERSAAKPSAGFVAPLFLFAAARAAAAAPESTTTTRRGRKAPGQTGERSHIEIGRPSGSAECGS